MTADGPGASMSKHEDAYRLQGWYGPIIEIPRSVADGDAAPAGETGTIFCVAFDEEGDVVDAVRIVNIGDEEDA